MSNAQFPPRKLINDYVRKMAVADIMTAPDGYVSHVKEATRTLDQNSAQWPYLAAFEKNLKWPVNGELVYMTMEEWKDVLTAAFKKEGVRLAQGVDGGVVMLGQRTSGFLKKEFSDWIEYLKWFAAIKGVEPIYKSERRFERQYA